MEMVDQKRKLAINYLNSVINVVSELTPEVDLKVKLG